MKEIHNVAVIGAGAMGRQIALNAATKGFSVSLQDSFPDACKKARSWAEGFLAKSIEKGKMTEEERMASLTRIHYTETVEEAVKDSDIIIEAIIEDEEVKRKLFREINQYAPKDAIIATNSSFIPSSTFKEDVENPERLCNLHYFNPAMLMKLVEVVRGEHTAEETIEAVGAFTKQIGKTAIFVQKEIEGFVVNRLLRACQNEAFFLYQSGVASIEDIDKGAELGLNYPLGPFHLLDLTGIDLAYMARQKKFEKTNRPEDMPPEFLKEKYKKGEYGKKTGKGFYDYTEKR